MIDTSTSTTELMMMKTEIYSEKGKMVYRKGNSRVIQDGKSRVHEVFKDGKWVPAKGYFAPDFIEKVKDSLK